MAADGIGTIKIIFRSSREGRAGHSKAVSFSYGVSVTNPWGRTRIAYSPSEPEPIQNSARDRFRINPAGLGEVISFVRRKRRRFVFIVAYLALPAEIFRPPP